MRVRNLLIISFYAFILFFSISACQTEGCTNAAALNYDEKATIDNGTCQYENGITLQMNVLVDDELIEWNGKSYTNEAGNVYIPKRLQFYLSDIKIYYASSLELKLADFHYFDAINNESFKLELADIAKGKVDSLTFVFGLRGALNQDYALPNEIYNINMQWPTPMGGGYHYMKFEGAYQSLDGSQHNFNLHLGRLVNTDGTTDPSFKVSLAIADLEIGDIPVGVNIGMDMNGWFDGEAAYDMESFGEGIMGNHSAQKLLKSNGKDDVFKYIDSWTDYLQ